MTGQTTQLQQNTNNMNRSQSYDGLNRSQVYDDFKTELSFLFKKKEQSLHDTIHDIITDFSKNIEDIKKRIITTLQSGVDINHTDNEGKTPLVRLFEKAKEKTKYKKDELIKRARFLIERGADIENTDTESQEQPEDKGEKTLTDKLKNLKLFGHSESITEKDIDSIHQSMKDWEEEVKGELKGYIKNATIKEVSRYGSLVQVTLKNGSNTEKVEVGEFFNSNSFKKDEISGFSIVNENGTSGLHCAVYDGIKHYVVTNDCSYAMNLKWWIEGEKFEITINIDADGSVALVEGNGVTWEQLEAHKDVKLGDLFLADALRKGRWKDGLQQSKETIRSVELQQGQSEETVINVGRGIETNYEHNKSKTHFGHNKGPAPQPPKVSSRNDQDEANYEKSKTHFGHNKGRAPQPPKVSSWGEANNSERNVETSTPNSNDAPLPHFSVSPIPFNETSSNQVPAHNLGVLTDDYCEDTGKRTITYNDGSVAVIEDVPDERDSVAVEAQQQPTLLAITYPDDDKNNNTRSSNSLEDDKFASTTMKSTASSSPYFSSLPPVNSFTPKQPPLVHTQQQQKTQDDDQTPVRANPPQYNHEEVLNEFDPLRNNNNVEKTTDLPESEFPSDELQIDSGLSSPTHTTHALGNKSIVEESSWLEGSTSGVPLKPVDPRDLSPQNERRLSEDGLREEYSINANGRTEIFNSNKWLTRSSSVSSTDSGVSSPRHYKSDDQGPELESEYDSSLASSIDSGVSSPRHSGTNKSEIDPERLENVAMMLVGLKEPDYNDAELSTEENASISGNQGSEWELEYDSSLDSNDEFEERDTALLCKASSLPNLSNLNQHGSVGVLRNDNGFIDDELTDDACTKLVSHEKEDKFLKIVDEAVDDAKARINGIEKNKQDYQISFPKKYGQTHGKTIKPSNPSLNQKIQSELEEKFNQPNNGLKEVEQTAKEVSPPAKKDYHSLLIQTKEGLKKLEPLPREIQRVNTNNQHLGYTETKQLWEKRISQELQEKQEKQQKKHEERGVLRS